MANLKLKRDGIQLRYTARALPSNCCVQFQKVLSKVYRCEMYCLNCVPSLLRALLTCVTRALLMVFYTKLGLQLIESMIFRAGKRNTCLMLSNSMAEVFEIDVLT